MSKDQVCAQDPARAHVFISGRVQGVFFRHYTCQRADSLKITGWVGNCYDGRVEAVFEGKRESVENMVLWSRQGPPSAMVETIDIQWPEYKGEFNGFSVRY